MYLDYNTYQIYMLFNESKKYTFAYIYGRWKLHIYSSDHARNNIARQIHGIWTHKTLR
jgi:hypothetical protein